ncbi:hypothetical protein D5047_02535 [Verminephrobacter eiseniae]|nr:hypothetical protein [Verminephrobacter eiseniae]
MHPVQPPRVGQADAGRVSVALIGQATTGDTALRRTTRRKYGAQRLRAGMLSGQARAVPAARIERPWIDLRQGQAPGFAVPAPQE